MSYLIGLFLLAAPPMQDPISQSISDSFEVRLITIEVVVTDSEGNPVSGLERDDFTLLVDGSQVDTSYFEEIRKRKRIQAPGEDEPEAAEPGNRFLVFIDDYFTEHLYRKPMFKRLFADLDKMGPADQMAIVRYMGKELEPLIGWSNDREALRSVLTRVRKMKTGQMQREIRLRMSGRHGRGRSRNEQIRKVTTSLAMAMRGFYQPGVRQNLVLVSSGWPVRPDYDEDTERFAVTRYYGVGNLRPITDTANLLGYTIYPMQLQLPDPGIDVSSSGPKSGSTSLYYSTFAVSLDSLSFLADETGGLVFTKALVRKDTLKQAIEDTHSYYQLGFTRFNNGSKRHGVKVEVNRPGLKTRYRKNFRFLSRNDEANMRTEGALLFGAAGSSLRVSFGKPEKKGLGKMMLPVRVHIPMDWATARPANGTYRSNLELRTLAEDNNGNRSDMGMAPISFSGPKPKAGEIRTYDFSILMRKKSHRLVFSLRDIPTGTLRVAAVRLDPKKLKKIGQSLPAVN